MAERPGGMASWRPMPASIVNLAQLRRGCAHCSLQQLCLPGGLDGEELQRLDEIVQRRREVQRGARLFLAGDPMSAVFVAREGAFKSVSQDENGNEAIVGFHLPGELIGLDAMGSGEHRCEAVALTPALVCQVPYAQLTAVAAAMPALQKQLMRVIGKEVGRGHDQIELLMRRQANERIALFLHGLSERYQRLGRDGLEFRLPMSRDEIANYLGLALETVSRGFSRLQDDGVIEVHGRAISILDPAQLEQVAHGSEGRVGQAPRNCARA